MTRRLIKTEPTRSFFARGRKVAAALDAGRVPSQSIVVSFEDPADLLRVLTATRLALFRAVTQQPDSIAGIAERLHRNRRSVERDVDELARVGLVAVETEPSLGRRPVRRVHPVARHVRLEADLA